MVTCFTKQLAKDYHMLQLPGGLNFVIYASVSLAHPLDMFNLGVSECHVLSPLHVTQIIGIGPGFDNIAMTILIVQFWNILLKSLPCECKPLLNIQKRDFPPKYS